MAQKCFFNLPIFFLFNFPVRLATALDSAACYGIIASAACWYWFRQPLHGVLSLNTRQWIWLLYTIRRMDHTCLPGDLAG